MGGRKGGGDNLVMVTDAQSPPVVAPPAPAPGRAHVVVAGVDGAKVMVDGKLVASGVREARIPELAAGEPHQLRVEAAGQPVHERTFTVAAGAEAEIAVTFSPPPPVVPAVDIRPAHTASDRRPRGRKEPRRRGEPSVPDRRPRQKSVTATAWSATTSSAVRSDFVVAIVRRGLPSRRDPALI